MRIALLTIAFLVFAAPVFAGDADATKLAADGEKLLAAGDVAGAVEAYTAAAKADPENAEYRRQALVLRRVIALRKNVDNAEPDAKWQTRLISLHVFYCDHGLVETALTMDRGAHTRAPSPTTASLVAEALLDLGRNDEAAAFLAGLPADQQEASNRLLLAISLARTGKKDAAKAAAKSLAVTDESGPGELYDHARLTCLLGDADGATALLVRSVENSSAKTGARIKKFAERCPDFAPLAANGGMAKVLAAQSRVAESGCSGGSGCGSCPNRSGCSGQTKEGEKKDAGAGCGDEKKTDG